MGRVFNNPRDITPAERKRVSRIVWAWVGGGPGNAKPTSYWDKGFASVEGIFVKTRPKHNIQLYRSEGVGTPDEFYQTRFTSWSTDLREVEGFCGSPDTKCRVVSAIFSPDEIVVVIQGLGGSFDVGNMCEVIVRPGHYHMVPWKYDSKPLPERLAQRVASQWLARSTV